MYKIIFSPEKKNIKKKICVPTLPNIFRPETRFFPAGNLPIIFSRLLLAVIVIELSRLQNFILTLLKGHDSTKGDNSNYKIMGQ